MKVEDNFIISGTPTLEMLDDVTAGWPLSGVSASFNALGTITMVAALQATDAGSDLHPWQ